MKFNIYNKNNKVEEYNEDLWTGSVIFLVDTAHWNFFNKQLTGREMLITCILNSVMTFEIILLLLESVLFPALWIYRSHYFWKYFM